MCKQSQVLGGANLILSLLPSILDGHYATQKLWRSLGMRVLQGSDALYEFTMLHGNQLV